MSKLRDLYSVSGYERSGVHELSLMDVSPVHASGVSCLIGKPELQRASCVPTYFGDGSSLRCYKSPMTAPAPVSPVLWRRRQRRVALDADPYPYSIVRNVATSRRKRGDG